MKYVMIPINRRYDDNNKRIVRRVLISYTKKVDGQYKGTKLIEKDPYFYDPKSSQKYIFKDDGFTLISNAYSGSSILDVFQDSLIDLLRPYEFDAGRLIETAYEFMADSEEEAIKIFTERDF